MQVICGNSIWLAAETMASAFDRQADHVEQSINFPLDVQHYTGVFTTARNSPAHRDKQ